MSYPEVEINVTESSAFNSYNDSYKPRIVVFGKWGKGSLEHNLTLGSSKLSIKCKTYNGADVYSNFGIIYLEKFTREIPPKREYEKYDEFFMSDDEVVENWQVVKSVTIDDLVNGHEFTYQLPYGAQYRLRTEVNSSEEILVR